MQHVFERHGPLPLRSASDRKNLALFLPFGRHNVRPIAANSGKRFPQLETAFIASYATFGNTRPNAARSRTRRRFRLLTGGLLVRIQPEEPNHSKLITYARRFPTESAPERLCPFLALFSYPFRSNSDVFWFALRGKTDRDRFERWTGLRYLPGGSLIRASQRLDHRAMTVRLHAWHWIHSTDRFTVRGCLRAPGARPGSTRRAGAKTGL